MAKKITTLCIVHQHPRILLGMKKRGFGAGKWNGFGGKLLEGETPEQAAKRELQEEAGIIVSDLERMGVIDFIWPDGEGDQEVHIFKAGNYASKIRESEEMLPLWFHVDEIPFESMWPDDKYWLPLFLEGKKFSGQCFFDESGVKIKKIFIEENENF